MKLTTNTNVSVDGVMQGLGGPEEDRSGGFERGGWAMPYFDTETAALIGEVYQRADAFLFGRRTYEVFAGWCWYVWALVKEAEGDDVGEWLYTYYSHATRTLDVLLASYEAAAGNAGDDQE